MPLKDISNSRLWAIYSIRLNWSQLVLYSTLHKYICHFTLKKISAAGGLIPPEREHLFILISLTAVQLKSFICRRRYFSWPRCHLFSLNTKVQIITNYSLYEAGQQVGFISPLGFSGILWWSFSSFSTTIPPQCKWLPMTSRLIWRLFCRHVEEFCCQYLPL